MKDFTSSDADLSPGGRRRETTRLLAEIAQADGDERETLIDQVVVMNNEVVRAVAQRYARRGVGVADLEKLAYRGLADAARTFDGTGGAEFLTHAMPAIHGDIKRWLRGFEASTPPMRRRGEPITAAMSPHAPSHTSPVAAIARVLDVNESHVLEAVMLTESSTSKAAAPAGNPPADLSLGGSDDHLVPLEVQLTAEKPMEWLTPLEQRIIRLHLSERMTDAEVGAKVGVAEVRVAAILEKILSRLARVRADDIRQRTPSRQHASRAESGAATVPTEETGRSADKFDQV